ncbi:MAG TPA: hypothetical protein VND15_01525 [Candidatus Acidoferrales bacterium]|nr:hypothetical protein [Candidatus Acidoferrales bacterium]
MATKSTTNAVLTHKVSQKDTESFLKEKKSISELLESYHAKLKKGGVSRKDRVDGLNEYSRQLLDAKIEGSGRLYHGMWFHSRGHLVAYVDERENGKRTFSKRMYPTGESLVPRQVSLSADRAVSEEFAKVHNGPDESLNIGVVFTFNARRVRYEHIMRVDNMIRALFEHPDAESFKFVDEQEVRVKGMDKDAIAKVEVYDEGRLILTFKSFPSAVELKKKLL